MLTSLLQDRTYFVGRRERRHGPRRGPDHRRPGHIEIHVWVPEPTVSTRHAELNILAGRIYLRDLGSTNGTFLIRDGRRVPFDEGYVDLEQEVAFGDYRTRIRDLIDND